MSWKRRESAIILLITRAVARTLIGGGGGGVYSYIRVRPMSFFSNQIQIDQVEKKSVGQNMNI